MKIQGYSISGVPCLKNGDARSVTQEIIHTMEELGVDTSNIVGLVFDTTSVNSGIHQGVVVQLQRYFGRDLLELACRHHIAELVSGAACSTVYGDTESPRENCFITFSKTWQQIDRSSYTLPCIKSPFLKNLQYQTVDFLTNFLNEDQCVLRDDYKELPLLTLLYLGGSMPKDVPIYAPGAQSHARWMSKIIYSIKIALFRDQLHDVFKLELLKKITTLVTFLTLFYVQYWFCSTSAVNAPELNLNLLKLLEEAKYKVKDTDMLEMITAAYSKLTNHLWYLSERLVPFSMFSHRVSDTEKSAMAKVLLKCNRENKPNSQQMPITDTFGKKKLRHFIGPDSWTFFDLFCGSQPEFLAKPVKQWRSDESYITLMEVVSPTKVVNDCAERVLGMVTDFHIDRITRSEEQKSYLFQVVKELRSRQKGTGEKTNVSKKMMKKMNYKL